MDGICDDVLGNKLDWFRKYVDEIDDAELVDRANKLLERVEKLQREV